MMNKIGLQSNNKEGSENSLKNQFEPVNGASPQNIAVKIEGCREDGEYIEVDYDTEPELSTIYELLDVKPKIENYLDCDVKPETEWRVAINKLKAKTKKNKKMREDLRLAKEREKELQEEMESKDEEMTLKYKEMKSKDEEIVVLKQSVKYWKKKAESRRQGHEVVKQFQSKRECYVRVSKVKMPSPPCLPPRETSSQAGSLAPSPGPPGGADTGPREEQVGAGGELEEEQGESSNHWRRHKLVKTGEKLHSCSICNKAFPSESKLKHHLCTHSGEKPISCDICLKSFLDAGNLKCHKRTHSGEKPYSCDICLKSFSQSGTLKHHKRTHSGEKPYCCDICKEAFSVKQTLKRHELTHSGEKPHVCQFCNEGFSRHDNLEVHKLIHKCE